MGYPSDLTDAEWQGLYGLLQPRHPDRRYKSHDLRQILNGLLYVHATQTPWSRLPEDFPAWELVYHYAERWGRSGRLRDLAALLGRGPQTMPHPLAPTTRRRSVATPSRAGQPRAVPPVLTEDEIEERVARVRAKR